MGVLVDIAVVSNERGGDADIMGISEAGIAIMNRLVHSGRKDSEPIGYHPRYTIDVVTKAQLIEIVDRDMLVVDGDLVNDYNQPLSKQEAAKQGGIVVSSQPLEPSQYPASWSLERRNFEDNYRYMMKEKDNFPFIITCANLEKRACLLHPKRVINESGMQDDRVFICIRCKDIFSEDYVHTQMADSKPIYCDE